MTNECLDDLGLNNNIKWPEYDEKILEKEDVKFVIQINGKKRSILDTKKEILEKDLLKIVKEDKTVNRYLEGKKIKKVIFVKNRLMNILINE